MTQNMQDRAEIRAPLEHPCYEGHFPGRPILPGVLLLELIVEAIGRGSPRAVAAMKFHHALSPGDSCELTWRTTDGRVDFRCLSGSRTVAEGTLTYGVPP